MGGNGGEWTARPAGAHLHQQRAVQEREAALADQDVGAAVVGRGEHVRAARLDGGPRHRARRHVVRARRPVRALSRELEPREDLHVRRRDLPHEDHLFGGVDLGVDAVQGAGEIRRDAARDLRQIDLGTDGRAGGGSGNINGGGAVSGGEGCGQGVSHSIAKDRGTIAGKSRWRNQTSRSLKEQHLCTRDTEAARWTSKTHCRKNCGTLREIAGNCGKLRTSPPPPGLVFHQIGRGSAWGEIRGSYTDLVHRR